MKTLGARPLISAVLITKNEALDIADCLASISFCDEIVIVDHQSADETVLLARAGGAKVIETLDWPGFGPQKQLALDAASGDWVLSIDADERVSPELRSSILDAIGRNDDVSFSCSRENYFLGRRMRFGGWSSDHVLRLAKRPHCSFTSDVVHESLTSTHRTRLLAGPLVHFSYRSVDELFEKQIRYARLGAQKLASGQKYSPGTTHLIAPLKALWTFLRLYIFQLGALDGWRGLIAAIAKSYETFWRYLLLHRSL